MNNYWINNLNSSIHDEVVKYLMGEPHIGDICQILRKFASETIKKVLSGENSHNFDLFKEECWVSDEAAECVMIAGFLRLQTLGKILYLGDTQLARMTIFSKIEESMLQWLYLNCYNISVSEDGFNESKEYCPFKEKLICQR